MNDRDRNYLEDMLSYALDAIELLGDADADALASDKMRRFAVTRACEIVGEAASRISEQGRAELTDLPWRSIVGMRNVLIHGYTGLDLTILTNTIKVQLPSLVETLRIALGDGTR